MHGLPLTARRWCFWRLAGTTFSGALSGVGTLPKVGTGQLTLSGGGAFSSTFNVQAGALREAPPMVCPLAAT